MHHVRNLLLAGLACAVCSALSGCKDKPQTELAPLASAALAAAPTPESATHFSVDSTSSKVTFLMDSPLEKIDGDASGSLSGDLFLNLSDIPKSTALVKVDLQKLVLYQQKRKDGQGEYAARSKSDLQNSHARGWLQLDPIAGEVTPEQAESNRWVEFKIEKIEQASLTNVAAATGATRTFRATVSGQLRLHGRKQVKSANVEVTVSYDGDKPRTVHVKTTEPLKIGLEEFEVNPRDTAGKFVKTLTEAISSNLKGKVAQEAPLELDFTATVK